MSLPLLLGGGDSVHACSRNERKERQYKQPSASFREANRTAEPLAKSVCGKVDGLDPARVLGSRDRAVREASAKDSEKLFLLLSGFQNSPIFRQGRPGYSRRAEAGGRRDRGDPAAWRPPPSLRTACCLIDCRLGLPFPYLENGNPVGASA